MYMCVTSDGKTPQHECLAVEIQVPLRASKASSGDFKTRLSKCPTSTRHLGLPCLPFQPPKSQECQPLVLPHHSLFET